jgi:hypothetical protein
MNHAEIPNFVISQPAMAFLTANVVGYLEGLKHIGARAEAFYEYPDGSTQVEGPTVGDDLWKLVPAEQRLEVNLNSYFRSLATFPTKLYELWYTADYAKKLGDSGFRVVTKPGAPRREDYDLERLRVTVALRRKPRPKVLERLAEWLTAWFRGVCQRGMFEEGPADGISAEMEIWSSRVAQFTIDVHRSGQSTLNWLSLSLLNFGYQVTPITDVFYDSPNDSQYPGQSLIELHLGLALQNSFRIPIIAPSRTPAVAAQETKEEEGAVMARLPPGCSPHPTVRSDVVAVLVTQQFQWEDFEVRVYFGAPVQPDAQHEFRRLVNSWLNLGAFGGWGGTGIDYSQPPEFDETADRAVFRADMGDADEVITALAVLVRIFEGFSKIVPIDAVVLGKVS